jgi:catechol 2,3-dioxygenase-like lactoylglutathione lyase family enzyme
VQPRNSLITLGVADLGRSVGFYRDGLGLPQRPGDRQIAFFETQATWLALYPRELLAADAGVPAAGSGFSGVTLAHNVRSQEQVDSLLTAAVAAGATLVKPALETDWGGYSGYFSDPDGHLWEVAWNPHFPID